MRFFTSHRSLAFTVIGSAAFLAVACGDDDSNNNPTIVPDGGGVDSGPVVGGDAGGDGGDAGPVPCTNNLSFAPGQEQALQDAVNSLTGCANITLAAGTFTFTNAITIRKDQVTFKGAGKGAKGELVGGAASTVLVFTTAAANTNGVDVVSNDFTISDLAILDAKKDSLRIESSKGVKIQRVRTEWTAENSATTTNGAYGVYPVKSENVLVEECEAYNASDAGIYVGQTKNAVLHKNIAKQNVAGIEIENCQKVDAYENDAEDNTGGLVVFDLPGNPVAGTDIRVYNNTVKGNNRTNFGDGSSTVSQIPAGTGTFILASRRVEFFGNTWGDNNTTDVAVLSGLAIEPNPATWTLGNQGTKDVYIHDNTFQTGSGDSVDNGAPDANKRKLGALVYNLYLYGATQGAPRVEPIIWDGIDPLGVDNNANEINLCQKTNTFPDATGTPYVIADLNFPGVQAVLAANNLDIVNAWAKTKRYNAADTTYQCAGITPAITPVVLP